MPQAFASPGFLRPTRSGIPRGLVSAQKEDRIVVIENVLGAVPMVDVPINDKNFSNPMFLLSVSGGNGCVIEDSKPHPLGRSGVMTGRTGQAKGMISQVAQNVINRKKRAAGGAQGDLPRVR